MTKAMMIRPQAALALAFKATGATRSIRREEMNRARAVAIAAGDEQAHILMDVLWYTGCRISEALALTVRDVDFSHGYIVLPTLKGRKKKDKDGNPVETPKPRRGVPVPQEMLLPLALYTRDRKLGEGDRLFKWKRTQAYSHTKAHLLAAGVSPDRAFPHALRHGHAINAILDGVPLPVIKETLGHSSILITQQYVRATGVDIAESYKRVTWT